MESEKISIDQIKTDFNLPVDAEYVGHILYFPESDEYLGLIEENEDLINYAYVKTPGFAKVFDSFESAYSEAQELKYKAIISLLFETKEQLCVAHNEVIVN